MSKKFHINAKGAPGACRARHACPFGPEGEHYATREDARAGFEARMGGVFKPAVKPPAKVTLPSGAKVQPFLEQPLALEDRGGELETMRTDLASSLVTSPLPDGGQAITFMAEPPSREMISAKYYVHEVYDRDGFLTAQNISAATVPSWGPSASDPTSFGDSAATSRDGHIIWPSPALRIDGASLDADDLDGISIGATFAEVKPDVAVVTYQKTLNGDWDVTTQVGQPGDRARELHQELLDSSVVAKRLNNAGESLTVNAHPFRTEKYVIAELSALHTSFLTAGKEPAVSTS